MLLMHQAFELLRLFLLPLGVISELDKAQIPDFPSFPAGMVVTNFPVVGEGNIPMILRGEYFVNNTYTFLAGVLCNVTGRVLKDRMIATDGFPFAKISTFGKFIRFLLNNDEYKRLSGNCIGTTYDVGQFIVSWNAAQAQQPQTQVCTVLFIIIQ
jgi:hypothetical protein